MTNCNEFFFLPGFSCRSTEASQNINLYGCMAFFLGIDKRRINKKLISNPFMRLRGWRLSASLPKPWGHTLSHRVKGVSAPLAPSFLKWPSQNALASTTPWKAAPNRLPFPLPDSPLPSPPGVTCWRRLDHRAHLLHQPLQATFHPWQAQHAPKVALCSSRSASAQNPAPLSWRPPPPVRRIRPRFWREHVTPYGKEGESEGHWLLLTDLGSCAGFSLDDNQSPHISPMSSWRKPIIRQNKLQNTKAAQKCCVKPPQSVNMLLVYNFFSSTIVHQRSVFKERIWKMLNIHSLTKKMQTTKPAGEKNKESPTTKNAHTPNKKTLEKRPNALKQKTHDQTTGHRPGMIHLPSLPTEPAGGEAVDLRFFFAERRCCGSNFRMETTIVPVTGTCTIWGGEAQGDFFLFGKKRCLLVVVGLAFFLGVFDIYFSYIISSCMYVSYIISSYIISYITYQKSIITYHLSCIIYH